MQELRRQTTTMLALTERWRQSWDYSLIGDDNIKPIFENIQPARVFGIEDEDTLTFILAAALHHGIHPKEFSFNIYGILRTQEKEETYTEILFWILEQMQEKKYVRVTARVLMALNFADGESLRKTFTGYLPAHGGLIAFEDAIVDISYGETGKAIREFAEKQDAQGKAKALSVLEEFAVAH